LLLSAPRAGRRYRSIASDGANAGSVALRAEGRCLDLLPAKLLFDRLSLDGNFYVSNKMVSNAYHLPDNDKIVLFLRQLMPFCNDKS